MTKLHEIGRALLLVALAASTVRGQSPPASHLEAVAFDVDRKRLMVFGGARPDTNSAWLDNDETWEWDGAQWRLLAAGADGPGARHGHSMTYDESRRRTVLVGGLRTTPGSQDELPLDDTWMHDGRRWTRGRDAPAISNHHLVSAGAERGVWLLGYAGRETYGTRRLGVWQLSSAGWTLVDSTGPMMRGSIRAAFDAKRAMLVVPVLADSVALVWEWNGRQWMRKEVASPSRRTRHALAYDDRSARVVLIGGRDENTRNSLGDAWSWDGVRWTMTSDTSGAPGSRASAAVVSDRGRGQLLLYGGVAPKRAEDAELWVRSDAAWTRWRQQTSQDSAILAIEGSFFALSVPDLDASVRWYVEKLGLRRVTSFPAQGGVTGVLLAGGGLEVELLSHTNASTVGNPMDAGAKVLTHGIMKVGFRVADFDRTVATLRARGVEIVFGPFPPRRDQRANVLIRDNAGNLIQLFGDFAR